MAKRIIGILGNPLPEENTAKLLDRALNGAQDAGCIVEKIFVPGLNIDACMEMMFCKDHGTCIMDGLIIATPIMTMGVPGKLKSFMDRFQIYFMAKYLRKEPFVSPDRRKIRRTLLISISGMKIPAVFDGVKRTVRAFCDIIDCPYSDEMLVSDMDTIKDIATRADLLDAAYEKGFALGK